MCICVRMYGARLLYGLMYAHVCVCECVCVFGRGVDGVGLEGGGGGLAAHASSVGAVGRTALATKTNMQLHSYPHTHTHTRALNAFLTKLHSTLSTHTHIHTRFVHKKNASLERGTVDGIVRPLEPAASCFPAPNTTRHSLFLRRPLTINPTFHCPSEMIPPPLFTYVPGTFFAATKHATKSRDSKTLKTTEKRQKFNLQYGKNL